MESTFVSQHKQYMDHLMHIWGWEGVQMIGLCQNLFAFLDFGLYVKLCI